jgi:hypothetical protein
MDKVPNHPMSAFSTEPLGIHHIQERIPDDLLERSHRTIPSRGMNDSFPS